MLGRLWMALVGGGAAMTAALLALERRYVPAGLFGTRVVAHGALWVPLCRLRAPGAC